MIGFDSIERMPGVTWPFKGWRSRAIVLSCIFVAFLRSAVAEPLPEDTIVIATGAWDPYVEVEVGPGTEAASVNVEAGGPLVEIIRQAYGAAGVKVSFVSHPWTRNAQLVESGAVDAALPYYCSKERSEVYLCSAPMVQGEQVFFHRRNMPFDWSGIDDLTGYTIGATLGYFYGNGFQNAEALGTLKVIRNARDDVNLKLLSNGRIDLFPQDKAVGYAMLRQLFSPEEQAELTHHPRPLHRESLHLIYTRATKRGARFKRLFDRELAKMRESGELGVLLKPVTNLSPTGQ